MLLLRFINLNIIKLEVNVTIVRLIQRSLVVRDVVNKKPLDLFVTALLKGVKAG